MYRFILILCVVFIGSSAGYGESLKVGYAEFMPFTYTDTNNKASGIFIDLARTVYRKMNISIASETAYPAARLMKNIESGKVDVWYGIKRPPMADFSIFGSELLGSIEMNLYAIGNVPEITKKEDLPGKSVLLILGYGYSDWGPYIRNSENNINYYQVRTHKKALETLVKGNFDYLLDYTYPIKNTLTTLKVPGLVKKQLTVLNCYFIISKKTPDGEAILKKLDKGLQEIKQSQ